MMRLYLCFLLCLSSMPAWAAEQDDYLYFRDVSIAPYQNLREFFDMPNRPGSYQITLVSDSVGPLTFTISRVEGDMETQVKQVRSYAVDDHEFHYAFNNPTGEDDLLVEIANSNPILGAKLSVIVVELPKQ
ncbi:hypothetical protein JYT58_01455 [bacterium AH-315-G11]|nr:hypothetical protein [bacterium AH-315-G11]